MQYKMIDGAQGEGGGQVLRTALTLSMLTQQNIEIINIRAGRKKPGLLRQHLTSVLAAADICQASTDGVELGAKSIRFAPKKIRAGNYHFVIGTAGSTVLVCQTIVLALAMTTEKSTVTFEGGTHNGMSPSLCFFEQSFIPILKKMGIDIQVTTESLGFYPVGGGKWQITIMPSKNIQPIHLLEHHYNRANISEYCSLTALLSKLSESIGLREIKTAKKQLGWQEVPSKIDEVKSAGSGNCLQIKINNKSHDNLFEVTGELGISAESVARRAAGKVKTFLQAQASVNDYLADQLLLPIALAKSGSFTTTKPSLHTLTNINVIKQLLDIEIKIVQINEHLWRVYLT